MDIKAVLKEFNLSDNEIEVYLACLKIGLSSVIRISELTGIPKSTCYDILNSLANKGLISQIIKESTKYFEATNPEFLLSNLHEKEKKLKEILPKLNALKKTGYEKPNVELYIGKEGMKSIYDQILKVHEKEYLVLGNHSKYAEFFDWFSDNFIAKRVDAGIKCRYISEDSEISKGVQEKDKKELRVTKRSKLMNNQNSEFYVFGNKVVFIVYSKGEPIGIVIENSDIAKLQKMMFEEMWKNS
jgi:sugar-specific transcriptional regulator TrmB